MSACNRRSDELLELGVNPVVRYFRQLAVLLPAMLGLVFCLISCYSLTILTARVVFAAVLFVLLFALIFSSKRKGAFALCCIILAALWTLVNADRLIQGFLLLLEQALSALNLRLPDGMQALLRAHDATEALALASVALTAILFVSAMLASYFVVCCSVVFGLALSTLPLIAPAPFFSRAPDVIPFFCLVCAHLILYAFNVGRYMPTSIAARGQKPKMLFRRAELAAQRPTQFLLSILAFPLAVCALLVCSLVLPQKGYERPQKVEALREKILALDFGDFSLKGNDGLTRGSLRSLSAIRFTGETAIKVRVSEERSLYLRDFAGVTYTSDGWTNGSARAYSRASEAFSEIAPINLHALSLNASNAAYDVYSLSVINVSASSAALWTPNGLVSRADEIAGAVYDQDVALRAAGGSGSGAYTLTATPCSPYLPFLPFFGKQLDASAIRDAYLAAAGSAVGLGDAADESALRVKNAATAYTKYVLSTYTALPEETLDAAKTLCDQFGLSLSVADGYLNLSQTVYDLHSLLTSQCEYAYDPPTIPSNTDFTTCFMTESRQGYCVHFATAATVLLRAMGVPARYAEGYIVIQSDFRKTADANGYIDIEDTHAHAWVEVFDPTQLEWIPVEVTASSGDGSSAAGSGQTPVPASEASDAPTIAPTAEITPSPAPTPISTKEPTPTPTEGNASSDEAGDTETVQEPDDAPSSDEPDEADAEIAPQEADAPLSPDSSPSPAPNKQTEAENAAPDHTISGDMPREPITLQAILRILGILALILLFPLGAYLFYRIIRMQHRKRFYQANLNAGVLCVCRYAMKLLGRAGCKEMQPLQTAHAYAKHVHAVAPWLSAEKVVWLIETAQRARFSGRSSTITERDEAIAFVCELTKQIETKLPKWQRPFFRLRYPAV